MPTQLNAASTDNHRFAEQSSDPAAPAAGFWRLYFKATGAFFRSSSAIFGPLLNGSTGATDNALIRADGTGGATIQNSAATLSDAGDLTVPGQVFADGDVDQIQLRVQGHSTQTSKLQTWENSAGTVKGNMDNDGNHTANNLALHADGRLTLTSGTPVTTSDVTAATTIYYTPYAGHLIALYDGTNWRNHKFTECSLSVPASTDTNYDVFIYDNAGTITLELSAAWTNDTTRADALALQDGILVKSGATTRRYLGTFRTTGVSGQTEDSLAKRFVWNYYHRVRRTMRVRETTDSWSYTTASYRSLNNSATNRLQYVQGVSEDPIEAMVHLVVGSTSALAAYTGIGVDSTTVTSHVSTGLGGLIDANGTSGAGGSGQAWYEGFPGIGFHYLQALEYGGTGQTFYGDAGLTTLQSGIMGSIQG